MTYLDRREAFVEEKRREAEEALPEDPSFEDYLEPHGEYGLPIYTGLPDEEEIVERIVSRRASYIESAHGLPEREAFALAAAQAGLSARWTAERVGVAMVTVSKYHDRVQEKLGVGVLVELPFTDVRQDLDVGVKSYRECPECGEESVESIKEIREIYNSSNEVMEDVDEDATHACTSCGIGLERDLNDGD